MDSNRFWQSSNDLLPLRFTTLTTSNEGVLYAGTDGKGVFQFTPLRSWENASQGLPDHLHIHRLDWVDSQLYASTNCGLYVLEDEVWKQTSVVDPCYRVIGWGDRFVLTSKGLLCGSEGKWQPLAYHNKKTFDMLVTPHFLFLGYEDGVAFYDLLTGDWCDLPLNQAVTSLAVFNQKLIGTTSRGGLVMGNKMGGFHQIRFEGMHLNRLVSYQGDVYVCANIGIYKLIDLKGRILLHSYNVQAEVTDLLIWRGIMMISTLQSGIKYKNEHKSAFQTIL
ncbi:hypothetical protein HZF08_21390 [Paenibacillus sp. CGMCC 1.16610]|uniref:Uncharacterized protein n=1 Tax=Paenibacillus anseongense TaxID=2682845 RepID=A0ABW9U1S0_9BACL|nr:MULTISPECIES: hypothetical protein [Paenibacillus]MBA2940841.1 hypothetical protein [Paenibacillus sp. CGMCC 1.16610]MVQ34024.1 hypothetical protein [Paenibacillus anseongense]